jgi:hypothetical protein
LLPVDGKLVDVAAAHQGGRRRTTFCTFDGTLSLRCRGDIAEKQVKAVSDSAENRKEKVESRSLPRPDTA